MTMRRREFLNRRRQARRRCRCGTAARAPRPRRCGSATRSRRRGPVAVGAGITQAPNYTLWQEQVNARGGLAVKGEGRRRIQLHTIDDRSEIETAVRFYEKLAADDKVDLMLPPWGMATNFGIARWRASSVTHNRTHRDLGQVQRLAIPNYYTCSCSRSRR